MSEEVPEQFKQNRCVRRTVGISSSPLFGFIPRLSLTSSQASLALIDPLVRACGITMSCVVKRSPQWEEAQMEHSNNKRITTGAEQRKFGVSA